MMKKNLFVLLLALILPLSFVCAENYPYRSDVLWVTVPNHADWIYKTGERLRLKFSSINMVFRKMVWRFYMSWEAT